MGSRLKRSGRPSKDASRPTWIWGPVNSPQRGYRDRSPVTGHQVTSLSLRGLLACGEHPFGVREIFAFQYPAVARRSTAGYRLTFLWDGLIERTTGHRGQAFMHPSTLNERACPPTLPAPQSAPDFGDGRGTAPSEMVRISEIGTGPLFSWCRNAGDTPRRIQRSSAVPPLDTDSKDPGIPARMPAPPCWNGMSRRVSTPPRPQPCTAFSDSLRLRPR